MIDLYFAPTPNGKKISIMLEECGLEYRVIGIHIGKGEQFTPEFLGLNPNGKIPVITDHEGLCGDTQTVFESGAILLYLAEKTGQFLPSEAGEKYRVIQWLMFQMGGFGPMLGQAHHFLNYAPEHIPYGVHRYHEETKRLYGVLDKRLAESEYLATDYSIADIAVFPWAAAHKHHQINLDAFSHVRRWFDQIKKRPAVIRGMALLQQETPPVLDAEAKKILFGIEPDKPQ